MTVSGCIRKVITGHTLVWQVLSLLFFYFSVQYRYLSDGGIDWCEILRDDM